MSLKPLLCNHNFQIMLHFPIIFLLTAFLSLVNLASAVIIFIVEKTIRQTNHAQDTTDKVMVNSMFA